MKLAFTDIWAPMWTTGMGNEKVLLDLNLVLFSLIKTIRESHNSFKYPTRQGEQIGEEMVAILEVKK